MDQNYLLEKIYDKYQMEIARKDRLEGKAIGYYTIIGIFFAAFLVIEPLLLGSQGLSIKFSIKDILSIINILFVVFYIVIFIISIIILHNSYKPKIRAEFDPIENWDILLQKDDTTSVQLVKKELIKIINLYEEKNDVISKNLTKINLLCIISALIIVVIFCVLVATYFI